MLDAINSAQKSLILEQSYFVPDVRFRKALKAAATRRVTIEIIVPGQIIDSKPTRHASQNHWRDYLEAGIRLHQFEPSMLHGKLLVADEKITIIGSANLDDRSFFINDEVNLHVDSQEFAEEQIRMFRHDQKRSGEITLSNFKEILAPWPNRFGAGLISKQL